MPTDEASLTTRLRNGAWRIFGNLMKPRIVAKVDGCQRGASKLCLFASYDAGSRVSPVVLHYLEELRRCNFDIVFCTTSERLTAADLMLLQRLCCRVIHRQNRGHDFYSWKVALEMVPDFGSYRGLLLTNDSIVGPLRSLSGEFDAIDRSDAQCLSLNDSFERGYHLQSFFLYFKPEVFRSRAFRRFWQNVRVIKSKAHLVKAYEIGLSQWLQREGVRLEALYPTERVVRCCTDLGAAYQYREWLESGKFNPTLMAWHELIEYLQYPFVKTDVVRKNRYFSVSYDTLAEVFADRLPADVAAYVRTEMMMA